MDITAMNNIGYGLYVISAKEGNFDNACIANTIMQVTISPQTIVITLNKNNFTHDMIKKSGIFNVSILTESAPFAYFERFGFHFGKDGSKFDGFETKRADNGIVFVPKHTNAYLSAKVVETMDCGTHTLFRAEIVECVVLSIENTMTYSYYHKNVKPKPVVSNGKVGFRCTICGYFYEGTELPSDFICPICKHGASDFVKVTL